jgi:hypothetical protein
MGIQDHGEDWESCIQAFSYLTANIHPVFHVSQLKKHLSAKAVPQGNLPLVTDEGYTKTEPAQVLDTRALPRNDDILTQWKVQWQNLTEDQASWEDKLFIKATFPEFYNNTLRQWWPTHASSGQEAAQGGGGVVMNQNRHQSND